MWLALAGRRGWTVLSGDIRVRRSEIERRAVTAHRVRYFVFRSNNISGADQAELLYRHDSRIRQTLSAQDPPYIAHITRGSVRIMLP